MNGTTPSFFLLRQNDGFRDAKTEDELLHPESFTEVADDSATETQYFGFNVPEANIQGYAYLWHHPKLSVCTGGLVVYSGVKPTTQHAELCDYRTFMSDAALRNDLGTFRLDNGYGVEVIEPLKRWRMTYENAERANSVDLVFEGVQPPVLFGDGRHMEQAVCVRGALELRGKTYNVDSFSMRDRSWGAPRPESLLSVPPVSWVAVTFDEDFAFNCCVFDQASRNPGPHSMPDDKAMSSGWVHKDGRLARIVKVEKRAHRAPGSTLCTGIELLFADDYGRVFDARGRLAASCPLVLWNNSWAVINLMRWECDGHVGFGDNQEAFWNDHFHAQS